MLKIEFIWSFEGYILIKRIKWELIRIKGELSKSKRSQKNSFTYCQFLGEKAREEPREKILILVSFVHRIKVRLRLSFNNNGLYNFDFGLTWFLVEIGNWGLGFGVWVLNEKGVKNIKIALECIQVVDSTSLHFCKSFWGLKLRKMEFLGKTAFCPHRIFIARRGE